MIIKREHLQSDYEFPTLLPVKKKTTFYIQMSNLQVEPSSK